MKRTMIWKTILFILILALLIGAVSYVFRLKSMDAETSIVGFYSEPKDTLDAVFIGASNVYWYWQAPLAYQQTGMTTLDYAAGSMPYAAFASVLRECLTRQSPRLILIDPRSFVGDNSPDAFGVHNLFDYMPESVNKYRTLSRVCSLAELSSADRVEYYVPFVRFHYIWEELDASCFRRDASRFKNAVFNEDVFSFVTDYTGEMTFTDEITPITGAHLAAFNDLLAECEVLFVSSPFLNDIERKAQLNYIGQMLSVRGYSFLNCNDPDVYAQIALSIPEDYFDEAHVNIHGSIKFTAFLADYLEKTYDLPDHRGEAAYASWDRAYEEYAAYMRPFGVEPGTD